MKNLITVLIILLTHASFAQQNLSVENYEAQLKTQPNAKLLDVRMPKEFEKGHLPNAINIDWRDTETFRKQTASLDKSQPLFVYCLSGGRSGSAMEYLVKEGFSNVANLDGGYLKWTAKNKPSVADVKVDEHQEYTGADFDKLLTDKRLIMIDFYAEWCGPCQKMLPIVLKLKDEMVTKVNVVKVDSDKNKDLMAKFNIDEIPTFLFFKDKKLVNRVLGYMTEDTMRMLIKEGLEK